MKIAGKEYPLEADSGEMEQLMRVAAKDVNDMLERFNMRFPETAFEDKMVFVAVQEAAGKLYMQKKYKRLDDEVNSLGEDLVAYLEGLDDK